MPKSITNAQQEPTLADLLQDDHIMWVVDLIVACRQRQFYGKLNIHFERGEIQRAVHETSLIPPTRRKGS